MLSYRDSDENQLLSCVDDRIDSVDLGMTHTRFDVSFSQSQGFDRNIAGRDSGLVFRSGNRPVGVRFFCESGCPVETGSADRQWGRIKPGDDGIEAAFVGSRLIIAQWCSMKWIQELEEMLRMQWETG